MVKAGASKSACWALLACLFAVSCSGSKQAAKPEFAQRAKSDGSSSQIKSVKVSELAKNELTPSVVQILTGVLKRYPNIRGAYLVTADYGEDQSTACIVDFTSTNGPNYLTDLSSTCLAPLARFLNNRPYPFDVLNLQELTAIGIQIPKEIRPFYTRKQKDANSPAP